MDETILPTRGGGMLTEGGAGEAALLRGVVWVQREKLFARWKERFCILTRDYLHCFKKGSTQLTECGPFLFKVCLKMPFLTPIGSVVGMMHTILKATFFLFICVFRALLLNGYL